MNVMTQSVRIRRSAKHRSVNLVYKCREELLELEELSTGDVMWTNPL